MFSTNKIGKQTFRDRVVIVHNLNHDYITGTAIEKFYHIATGFSVTGRHFLSVNGQMFVQSIPTPTIEAIIKDKGKIKYSPHSVTVVSVKTPPNVSANLIYKINHKFPLPSSMISKDIVHKFYNKVPHELKIPILNANNNITNITKNMALVSLRLAVKVDSIFSLDWDTLLQTRQLAVEEVLDQQQTEEQVHDLLPEITQTNLQFEADKPKQPEINTPNAEVPKKALLKLQHLLEVMYNSIVSKSATDIGRTKLIELDIPTEGPPIACKPYSIPLKYQDFVDQEIKQLEHVGVISHLMSNWASPILPIPKKPNQNVSSTTDKKQFNLRLCIDYHILNNRVLTARQIKADGRLEKVVENYLLPTIDNLVATFKDCKYFSTLDLSSGYYHIKLTLEAAEKTAFIINKGKWKFHSLPSGMNLGPSTFSYVLSKVLTSCHNFALNYLDNIIIFSRTWEDHLRHLEVVFKHLKHVDLKIKHSQCKFFKSKVHYLGYLVGVGGVQSLPKSWKPSRNY